MEYKLNEQTLNELLNYLATKPFMEVAKLIDAVKQAKPVEKKTATTGD